MNFIVSSGILLNELQLVGGIISTNVVVPILENFLFELDGDKLTIVGSDMETVIKTTIEVQTQEVEGEGNLTRICVPSKMFLEYLKNLPEQPLHLIVSPTDFSIEITSSLGKYKIGGENGMEYPKEAEPTGVTSFKLSPKTLSDAVNKTLFAVSNDSLRPAMTGVYFEMNETDGLIFVSTDGHRLVKYARNDIKAPSEGGIIVPKKPLQHLKGILGTEDEENVTISFNNTHLFIETEEMKLSSRLIEGRFPPYRAVIPEDNPYALLVDKNELISSLRRITIFASKSTQQVVFDIVGNTLNISAQDIDFSFEGNETLPCQFDGPDMKIGFNGKFLLEMLNNFNGEEIKIELSTPNKAGIFMPSEPIENVDLLMLLMPLMVGLSEGN